MVEYAPALPREAINILFPQKKKKKTKQKSRPKTHKYIHWQYKKILVPEILLLN